MTFHILGSSSSQLTDIFQRGRYTTNQKSNTIGKDWKSGDFSFVKNERWRAAKKRGLDQEISEESLGRRMEEQGWENIPDS